MRITRSPSGRELERGSWNSRTGQRESLRLAELLDDSGAESGLLLARQREPDFDFTLGGPLVRDKLWFFASYRWFGRHRGVTPEMWGAAVSRRELLRTFWLALILFAFYFMLVFTLYFLFHVDYNFLFMGVRPFRPVELLLLFVYAPFFFLFFLSNSLRVNGAMRTEGQPEWQGMLLGGIGNSLGLLLIVVVQYVTFWWTGTVYWTDGWLYVNLLFAVVPMMFVLPYFNRYFFRMTGRIYLGPMTTGLIFIMILISNTVIYIPL